MPAKGVSAYDSLGHRAGNDRALIFDGTRERAGFAVPVGACDRIALQMPLLDEARAHPVERSAAFARAEGEQT